MAQGFYISYLHSAIFLLHHTRAERRDPDRDPPVDRNQQHGEHQPGEEGDADLAMQQVESDGDLEREAPEVVKARAEVEDAIDVRAHEVDDLADGERREGHGTRENGFPIDARYERRADLDADDLDQEVEVSRAERAEERAEEETRRVGVAVPRRLRGILDVGDQPIKEHRADEGKAVCQKLQYPDGVVFDAESSVQGGQ